MPRLLPRLSWSWHGVAGVILSTCVGIAFAVALIATAFSPHPITDKGAELLTNLGGVLVGAVATWLGSAMTRNPNDSGSADGSSEPPATTRQSEPGPSSQATPTNPGEP